jgi:hypothetical protein
MTLEQENEYMHVEDLIVEVVIAETAGDEEGESVHLVCRETDRSLHVRRSPFPVVNTAQSALNAGQEGQSVSTRVVRGSSRRTLSCSQAELTIDLLLCSIPDHLSLLALLQDDLETGIVHDPIDPLQHIDFLPIHLLLLGGRTRPSIVPATVPSTVH